MTDRQDRRTLFRELGKYSALGLELAISVILGPSNACYLAELGAETIKVELPKRGEPMRHTTPFNEPFLYPLSRWMPDKGTGLGFFGANPSYNFV